MAVMRGAEALVRTLEAAGARYLFGYPGHGNMNILDALYCSGSSIEFKLTMHEQAAASIADGYARVSGGPGYCTASVGPGVMNLMIGLGSAAAASSPVVAIGGGAMQKWVGRGQLQEAHQSERGGLQSFVPAFAPVVKLATQIPSNNLVPEVIRHAIVVSRSGRPGPVYVEYPWDLQAESFDYDPADLHAPSPRSAIRPDSESLRRAVAILREAKHPVIVAGNGAVISRATDEILELAALLGAPVATSQTGKGAVPEDHPLSVGVVGWHGTPVAHELIREHADVVLVLGFRFSDLATCNWTEGKPFVRENTFVQVDIEADEIGRKYPVAMGLVGDVRETVVDLVELLRAGEGLAGSRAEWLETVSRVKAAFTYEIPDAIHPDGLEPMPVIRELRSALPADAIVASDTGDHQHYFGTGPYPLLRGGRFLNPGQWTPCGFAPVAIIGAKLAAPATPCVAVTGDGGFMMVIQEVATAVEWGTPVVWVVFDDRTLSAIRAGQQSAYEGHVTGVDFQNPIDFVKAAEAMGAIGFRPTDYATVGQALREALASGRPAVVSVPITKDKVPPPEAGQWYDPVRREVPPLPRGNPQFAVRMPIGAGAGR
jgi:acetolactate synthase-1/2/3 large subunit